MAGGSEEVPKPRLVYAPKPRSIKKKTAFFSAFLTVALGSESFMMCRMGGELYTKTTRLAIRWSMRIIGNDSLGFIFPPIARISSRAIAPHASKRYLLLHLFCTCYSFRLLVPTTHFATPIFPFPLPLIKL
jgi:hypothetical protein